MTPDATPVRLPDDAGDYTDGLTRLLTRIPTQWGRYLSVGPGWYPLLVDLDTELAALAPDYQVCQVKEKFGTLRFYWTLPDAGADLTGRIRALVAAAEATSARTCETCGAGVDAIARIRRGWIRTQCPACAAPDAEPLTDDEDDDRT